MRSENAKTRERKLRWTERLTKFANDFRPSILRTALMLSRGKRAWVGVNFRVRGYGRISVAPGAPARLGTQFFGFSGSFDAGLLRARGQISLGAGCSLGPGARVDVGPHATAIIGAHSYLAPQTLLICDNTVIIGDRTAIGWQSQILDNSFHQIERHDAEPSKRGVEIGDHCWIGSRVTILPGVRLAPNTIVAANSTVTKSFPEPNCLIGGNPARVLRRGVTWS